ncbi:MAG: LysR family transcriptional regulator [Deltaproteobacteria bacterium]
MINLHHLRIFYNVARHRSHTRAARRLCISQPAVTNQLKAFEEKLGLKLLVKKQKSILLTEEGKVLYQYAQKLFDLENEIEQVAGDLKGLKIGTVRLGVLRMYSPTFMHVLINQFHKIYPNIMVKVDEAGSLDLIQSLLDYKNEVVICLKAEENSSILFKPFCQEDLVIHIATLRNRTVSAPAQCLLNVLQDLAPCEKPFGSVANLIRALKGEGFGETARL